MNFNCTCMYMYMYNEKIIWITISRWPYHIHGHVPPLVFSFNFLHFPVFRDKVDRSGPTPHIIVFPSIKWFQIDMKICHQIELFDRILINLKSSGITKFILKILPSAVNCEELVLACHVHVRGFDSPDLNSLNKNEFSA